MTIASIFRLALPSAIVFFCVMAQAGVVPGCLKDCGYASMLDHGTRFGCQTGVCYWTSCGAMCPGTGCASSYNDSCGAMDWGCYSIYDCTSH